jgi:hypothetical protein
MNIVSIIVRIMSLIVLFLRLYEGDIDKVNQAILVLILLIVSEKSDK